MMWMLAIVAVLLLGGVAVVAAGGGSPMKEQGPDRSGQLPPGDGPISARELREVRFSTVVRGYAMGEVDELLRRLERQIAAAEEAATAPAPATSAPPAAPEAPAQEPLNEPVRGDERR